MADAPAPNNESFLHSLATSIGVDPEAVKQAATAIWNDPVNAAKGIGSEAADEVVDAAKNPVQTAKNAGKGVVAAVTNPDAQKVASGRYAQPGVSNKLAGIGEWLSSGIPLVGGNIVKAEEQSAQGNLKGAAGTTLGTIAPALLESEPVKGTANQFVQSAKEGLARAVEAKAPAGSPEAGFVKIGGKPVISAPQGGHAGGGVASVEELNRPGQFVKVSRSGELTNQGKTPDFKLRNGEVGYQVKPDGTTEVKDGVETPQHKKVIDQFAKTVYPQKVRIDLSPAYGDTGREVSQPYILDDTDEVPEFISNAPEGKLAQDAPAASSVKNYVEENGGVFRGMQVDKVGNRRIGLVHFDVPPEMVGGKKNVTASIALDKATPEGIRSKVAEMAAQHNK